MYSSIEPYDSRVSYTTIYTIYTVYEYKSVYVTGYVQYARIHSRIRILASYRSETNTFSLYIHSFTTNKQTNKEYS